MRRLTRIPAVRIALHAVILFYVAVTLDGFAYTMLRVHSSVLPWGIVRYAYAAMAPYQGFRPWNMDLVAEGLRDDSLWEAIDLLPYYPAFSRGQINVRQQLLALRWRAQDTGDDALVDRAFTSLAEMIREREAAQGRVYSRVRLTWVEWPVSPAGYAFLRNPLFLRTTPLTPTP